MDHTELVYLYAMSIKIFQFLKSIEFFLAQKLKLKTKKIILFHENADWLSQILSQ